MAEALWQPSETRVSQAILTRFITELRREPKGGLSDFADLYRFSIDVPAAF